MEDDKAGSEHTLPCASSKTSLSDSKMKKPCKICRRDGDDSLRLTCVSCRGTREHIYCVTPMLNNVPPIGQCEECLSTFLAAAKTDDGKEISLSDSKNKKPCEVLPYNDNKSVTLTCVKCGATGEDFWGKVWYDYVPAMWECEKCLAAKTEDVSSTETSSASKQKQSDSDVPSGSESTK